MGVTVSTLTNATAQFFEVSFVSFEDETVSRNARIACWISSCSGVASNFSKLRSRKVFADCDLHGREKNMTMKKGFVYGRWREEVDCVFFVPFKDDKREEVCGVRETDEEQTLRRWPWPGIRNSFLMDTIDTNEDRVHQSRRSRVRRRKVVSKRLGWISILLLLLSLVVLLSSRNSQM